MEERLVGEPKGDGAYGVQRCEGAEKNGGWVETRECGRHGWLKIEGSGGRQRDRETERKIERKR